MLNDVQIRFPTVRSIAHLPSSSQWLLARPFLPCYRVGALFTTHAQKQAPEAPTTSEAAGNATGCLDQQQTQCQLGKIKNIGHLDPPGRGGWKLPEV